MAFQTASNDYLLIGAERERVLDALYDALTECELSEDISQGVIDKLTKAVTTLGGKYES